MLEIQTWNRGEKQNSPIYPYCEWLYYVKIFGPLSLFDYEICNLDNSFLNIENPLSRSEDAIDRLSLGGKLSLYYFSYILR